MAMLANSLLVLSFAVSALASPFHNSGNDLACKRGSPVLPINGGPSELLAPPGDVKLKHIALGFGIQNYTCTGPNTIPAATGALAVLYDITHLYPGQSHSSLTPRKWASFPSDVLSREKVPLNRDSYGGASLTNPFPKKQPLKMESLHKNIPYLGHHFFNSAGVPTFDLNKVNHLLVAKKIGSIKAPASALLDLKELVPLTGSTSEMPVVATAFPLYIVS